MDSIQNFDFFRLKFDEDGAPLDIQSLDSLMAHITASGATDLIFIAHGFRNSEDQATTLYTNFLTTFRQHVNGVLKDKLDSRKYAVAGVYWPSKAFDEVPELTGSTQAVGDDGSEYAAVKAKLQDMEDNDACPEQKPKLAQAITLLDQVQSSTDAQNEFVKLVLSLLDDTETDPTEGLENVRSSPGSELLDKLKFPIIVPTAANSTDDGGATAISEVFVPGTDGDTQSLDGIFTSVFGRIGKFLNMTTWYLMKSRSSVVGSNGVAQAVLAVKKTAPNIRIHLVGHSLGGRLMAACSKTLSLSSPIVRLDSLTLLEAAFSHYGFSPDIGDKQVGFFREAIANQVIKGPLIATFSKQDEVVGLAYAIASRLAGDNVKAVGDANDPYGGMGRNGAQLTPEASSEPLRQDGSPPYQFPAGKIVSLDGSDGLITSHGDVTNPAVTFAFACSVAQT